jgi:hypothetical protein
MQCPKVPISIGELLDKITILQIKSERTDNHFVHKELQDLTTIAKDLEVYREEYLNDLKTVNMKLWDVEDRLRELEKLWKFDEEFIDLARQVYTTNDERARIKKRINDDTNSEYSEVKLY